ncbi:hypothetical protein NXC12_CH02495 [Rhizobium etli]|uniref:Uncharacterized protein n=1 Tax=Rhizobium etli TaxID=29449 RepID=A0AAN1BG92_RHIET|nr:hypothetical protein NXC12_CH02495 [Rhizobium etli]
MRTSYPRVGMNAAPKGLYPLSSKAVITLSALDLLSTTRRGKATQCPTVNPKLS